MAKWLTYAKAAELLEVCVRTIKRWVTCPESRGALGVVRHGHQWRIPRPDDEGAWGMHTRHRLIAAGVCLRPSWEAGLRKLGRRCDRYLVESYRLWLAAYIKALERGRVTQKTRENLLLLWQTACEVLDPPKPLKRYEMDVEQLKAQLRVKLREQGFPVKSIMHYWPEKRHFAHVRAAHTRADFEGIRRELDFWQAYRDELRRRRGKEPSAARLCHLLHKDLMTHINDTRETLPGTVVKPQTAEELRGLMQADVWVQMQSASPRRITEGRDAQGRTYARIQTESAPRAKTAPLYVDLRQSQNGICLRTLRTRYSRAKQKTIIGKVRRILFAPPSSKEEVWRGKTPVRDSGSSADEHGG